MRLVVYISAHGFGHAAQTCAVLNAMANLMPELEITLVSRVDAGFLAGRLTVPYRLIERTTDIGLVMCSAIEIDLAASRRAYRQFHADWPRQVSDEAERLAELQPQAVLSNISYLGIAAADEIGVPAVALCCLNWASVYRHYFAAEPQAPVILQQMLDAYHAAKVFLTTPPVWEMPEIANRKMTGLLAGTGADHRDALRRRLAVADDVRLGLIGFGGVATRLPLENWPRQPGYHWLAPADWQVRRQDVSSIEATGLSFSDLIASVDLVLGKIGYGLVAECAVNGTPLLYIERPDWPEERPFSDWLNRHGRCAPVAREQVERGDIFGVLAALLSREAPEPPKAEAERAARDCLDCWL